MRIRARIQHPQLSEFGQLIEVSCGIVEPAGNHTTVFQTLPPEISAFLYDADFFARARKVRCREPSGRTPADYRNHKNKKELMLFNLFAGFEICNILVFTDFGVIFWEIREVRRRHRRARGEPRPTSYQSLRSCRRESERRAGRQVQARP